MARLLIALCAAAAATLSSSAGAGHLSCSQAMAEIQRLLVVADTKIHTERQKHAARLISDGVSRCSEGNQEEGVALLQYVLDLLVSEGADETLPMGRFK